MEKQKEELSQELQQYETLKEPMAIGQVFAQSGMFPDVKTQAQAVVKILAGREMGLTPFEAMNNIYIVNNRIAIMSNALASIVKKSRKYTYTVEKLDDAECTIAFFYLNGESKEIGKSTFTFKDAAKAGLANKENWKNYPRNMLFARALSNGVRWFCPDAACGYTVEEMQDVIDVTPVAKKTVTLDEGGVSNDTQS